MSIPSENTVANPHDCDHMFMPEVILSQKDVAFKSREKMVLMKIDDFLSMALYTKGDPHKTERIEEMIKREEKFNAVPFLIFYPTEDGTEQVCGHEGRHRAMGLKRLGYESMPVILKTDIRWSEQYDEDRFDNKKNWPEKLYSQNGKEISIPFPVKRAESDDSYVTSITDENLEPSSQSRKKMRP